MPESTRGKLQWIVPGGTSIAPRILSPPELPNSTGVFFARRDRWLYRNSVICRSGLAGAISFLIVGCAVNPSVDVNETPQQREQRIRQENMAHMNLGVSVNSVVPRVLPGDASSRRLRRP